MYLPLSSSYCDNPILVCLILYSDNQMLSQNILAMPLRVLKYRHEFVEKSSFDLDFVSEELKPLVAAKEEPEILEQFERRVARIPGEWP